MQDTFETFTKRLKDFYGDKLVDPEMYPEVFSAFYEFPWSFADGEFAAVVVIDDTGAVRQEFFLSCDQR